MTIADVADVPLSEVDHRAQLRRAVIASTVGTTIEWYDFRRLFLDCINSYGTYGQRYTPYCCPSALLA